MVLRVECSHCGREYKIKDENAGKRLKCKECGKVFQVPDDQFDDYGDLGDDYGDEYGEDDGANRLPPAPRTGKSRKSRSRGRRKAGMPAGVKIAIFSIVGVVAVGLLGWGAVTLGVKLFADTHESLLSSTVDAYNDWAEILEDVEDVESAKAAGAKLVAVGDRIADVYKRHLELKEEDPISKEEEKQLGENYKEQFKKARQRIQDEMKRIVGMPDVLAELREPLKEMVLTMNDVRREARAAGLEE